MALFRRDPDAPRIPRKDRAGASPLKVGAIVLALALVATYFGFTKHVPFTHGYRLNAVFQTSNNLKPGSPVRIAGVNVGKVKKVERYKDTNMALVQMEITDEGLPIHKDATAKIRPRIFLEGNFFVDLKPGTPQTPTLDDDDRPLPMTQTASPVQLDQILTSLQAPDRANLQKLLQGYGNALAHEPTAADDATQDPDVQGLTAAEAINESFTYGQTAARDSAIVNEALQGTSAHDLSDLIAGQARIFNALTGHESQLQGLITNFNTVTAALADESANLQRTIRLLGPTLEIAEPSLRHTNATLPQLRTFARELAPGVRELPATIAVSQPWINQTTALLGRDELGYIASQLRLAGPGAGKAAADGRGLFSQIGLLSGCVDNVLLPTGDVVLNDSGAGYNFNADVPNFKEFGYATTGLAGESAPFDGNGPSLRFFSAGGPTPATGPVPNLRSPVPGGGFQKDALWGGSTTPPIGTRPALGSKPAFRTDVACQSNAVPDLNGPLAAEGPPDPAPYP